MKRSILSIMALNKSPFFLHMLQITCDLKSTDATLHSDELQVTCSLTPNWIEAYQKQSPIVK